MNAENYGYIYHVLGGYSAGAAVQDTHSGKITASKVVILKKKRL